MCIRIPSCCFCISLRTGSLISVVIWIAGAVVCIVFHFGIQKFMDTFSIIVSFMEIAFHMTLLCGIIREKRPLILYWLVVMFLKSLMTAIFFLFEFSYVVSHRMLAANETSTEEQEPTVLEQMLLIIENNNSKNQTWANDNEVDENDVVYFGFALLLISIAVFCVYSWMVIYSHQIELMERPRMGGTGSRGGRAGTEGADVEIEMNTNPGGETRALATITGDPTNSTTLQDHSVVAEVKV